MMKVVCISERSDYQTQIHKGQFYKIDLQSIWLDGDGDAYGFVYELNDKYVGQMKLCHFSSV